MVEARSTGLRPDSVSGQLCLLRLVTCLSSLLYLKNATIAVSSLGLVGGLLETDLHQAAFVEVL